MQKRKLLHLSLISSLCISLSATEFIVEDFHASKSNNTSWIVLPYLFSSDSTGVTAGVIGIFNGFIQPQMSIFTTLYFGEKLPIENFQSSVKPQKQEANSKGFAFGITGYKPSFSQRMFLSFYGNYAYYPNQKIYLEGGNDSVREINSIDINNLTPFHTQGYNNWAKLDFRYVLPLGEGLNSVTPIIKLEKGIAANRDTIGNGTPFVTGQTILGLEFFYSRFTADKLQEKPSLNTNGVRLYLEHDNTDYPDNPSRGYNMKFTSSFDFDFFNSSQSWNSMEVAYSHYLELANYSWSNQNLFAFNFWSAYTPSWDKSQKSENGMLDLHQAPMWEGARLGGYNRLRAYDTNRFSDKAALYFALEYRVIPDFNPLRDEEWAPVAIDWFQTVLFAEAGRVAPEYNVNLFKDMKYDVGLSLRALTAKVPMRFEVAYGEEGVNMWVMIKQPF